MFKFKKSIIVKIYLLLLYYRYERANQNLIQSAEKNNLLCMKTSEHTKEPLESAINFHEIAARGAPC